MMTVVDALTVASYVLGSVLFVTQVAWPVLRDQPLWPLYRRWKARRTKPAVRLVDFDAHTKEGTHDDDAA